MTGGLFWTDDAYDRQHASDGVSRFGHDLRARVDQLQEELEWSPAGFLASVWYIASPPVMSPGYIQTDRQVLDHRITNDPDDGRLVAIVRLAARSPAGRHHGSGWTLDWNEPRRYPMELCTVENRVPLPGEEARPRP